MVKRKRYLYHVTEASNVENIKQFGLKRWNSNRSTMAVYLSEKPLSWYQEGLRILRVDISGLSCTPATTFLPDSDEVLFWDDIPAWKQTKTGFVSRITDVTDKYVNGKRREPNG